MTANPIVVLQTDITRLAVDAIVNAANTSLLGGGGVDGAIHRAAGPDLREACRLLGGCETGAAKLTPGFRLPAASIIHTVGPVWRGGNAGEPDRLAECYRACFAIAADIAVRTIAFPAISCGAYGFPIDLAVDIALRETRAALAANPALVQVAFACVDPAVHAGYVRAIEPIA
jgi:O-acetyl-ADP-ribose deacetylase (regulator of RNase III)